MNTHNRQTSHTTAERTAMTNHTHQLAELPSVTRARLAGWLGLAERGWHLFPVRAGDKRPAIRGWQHRASTDPDRLLEFYSQHPTFNAGIACGPSGLLVVDADIAKAGGDSHGYRAGAQVLAELAASHGRLPDSFSVSSPSGGQHVYFTVPPDSTLGNTARTLGPLLDTRGAGGYVLAPGSWLAPRQAHDNHPGHPGGTYELLDDTNPAELPAWLHQALTEHRPPAVSAPAERTSIGVRWLGRYLDAVLRQELERVHTAGAGAHNSAVFTAARALGQLAAGGALDPAEAEALLTRTAAQIAAGPCDCTSRTLAATIRSGLAHGARRPRRLPPVERLERKATA
jgi:hypothetical protein